MAAGAVASRNMRIDFRVADRPRLAQAEALPTITSRSLAVRIDARIVTRVRIACLILQLLSALEQTHRARASHGTAD